MALKSINPYNGKVIFEVDEMEIPEVEDILTRSLEAFTRWKKSTFGTRSNLMTRVAALLRKNVSDLALVITSEMGKPLRESRAEIEKCAWVCEYYAENAAGFLQDEKIVSDAGLSYARYDPLGPVLGIMPWNFPFWQVFRFAVPTLMAGNTVLLKHSSGVQMCALRIGEIFTDAGFPEDVFRNLIVGSDGMNRIIGNNAVKAVSLTGSEQAGRKVAQFAGSVLKKCVLELGGSNAFVVLEDADLRKAADTAVLARFQNAGQSCIAAKRFIVQRNISEEFISVFRENISRIRTGDPADPRTEMGPLASISQAGVVLDQVNRSVQMGARVVTGGKREDAMFQPSLVLDVKPGMPLFDEEVFGPVAPVTIAENAEEAIALSQNSSYGLGLTIFTNDIAKAERYLSEIQDGSVFINGLVKSDPRLPFGGTQNSGYGRELSRHGIREFVNVKTVWIR